MAVADYLNTVQKIYIAFYQRPADPAGLKFWAQSLDAAKGDQSQIINAFATSAEASAVYGNITAANIGTVIDSIYQALFNRAPDAAGKQFYVAGFTAGTFTAGSIALRILDGASNTDKVAIDNKLTVANDFTQQVDGRALSDVEFGTGTSFQATYAGDADAKAARDILKTVTSNPSTVLSHSQVTVELQSKIADAGDAIGGVTSGKTFTLTTGVDTLTGTNGNDIFVADNTAGAGKYQSSIADTINGGAGTDTLKIFSDATNALDALPTLNSVEKVWINAANYKGKTLDVSGVTGLTSVELNKTTNANANETITVKVAGQSLTLSDISLAKAAVLTGATTTFAIDSAADTAANVTVSNVSSTTNGTNTQTETLDIAGGKVTTLNLTSTGAANKLTIANTGTKLDTINVSGDKALDASAATLAATVKVFNAAASTGGVKADLTATTAATLAVTGGAGADTFKVGAASIETVDLGAGNDTLDLSGGVASVTTADTYKGGDGTDTLKLASAADANTLITNKVVGQFTGFEQLTLGSVGADLDVSKFGVNYVTVSGDVTAAKALTGLTSGATLALTNDGTHTAQVSVGITGATDAGTPNDTLNIVMNADVTAARTYKVGVDGINILNISANDTDTTTAGSYVLALGSAQNVREVNVSGAAAVTLNASTWAGTEGVKLTDTGSGNLTFTGTALSDVITGGSGANTITGGNGKDIINISASTAKQDTIVLDGVKAAANADTITGFVAGAAATSGDLVHLATADVTGVGGSTFVNATAAATVVNGNQAVTQFNVTATNGVIELGNAALGSNGNLSAATDGTELLKALASSGTATGITAATVAGGDKAYFVAYQGGDAFLYYGADAGGTAGLFEANELTLVGTFKGVAAGAFAAGDFVFA